MRSEKVVDWPRMKEVMGLSTIEGGQLRALSLYEGTDTLLRRPFGG